MDPATTIADAMFADLPAGGTPQIAFALADSGKAALTAGGLARGKTTAFDAVKWPAAMAAAPTTPLLAGDTDRHGGGIARLFHECGQFCFGWAALGNGLGLASALGISDAAAIKTALGQAGIAAGELAWTSSDLVFLEPPGATPPAWKTAPTGAIKQSAAEACYRKALLGVRAALRASYEDAAHLADADTALAGAASCAGADPAIAARHKAMTELVAAIRALPRPPPRVQ
jgi:hypothetical protein